MSQALLILAKFIHSLDNSYVISQTNTMNAAVEFLDQIFDENPKIIAKNIDQLINTLEYFVLQPNSSWLLDKAHFYDFLVSVVNKYPKVLNNQNTRGSKIFKLALDLICQISSQVSQEWMNPPDGFKDQEEQDLDSQTCKQIMSSVDVLSETIGIEQTLTYFQRLFLQYIQKNGDWRFQYAALILASQIVNQEVVVDTLSLIVQAAISMTEHNHPKVKYAALHLLGQYSQDLNADFQEIYYNSLIPVTMRLILDPIPRVVAHTFACMTNFFQKCKELWKLQNIVGKFLNPILHYIKIGNTWVKEAALATLVSFAHTEDAFGSNLQSIFQLCGDLINRCTGKEEYKQILNESFQLVSILLTNQKKQLVQPYLTKFITLLFKYRDEINISYYLQCWNRISCEYQNFADIHQFFPYLMQKTNKIFVDITTDDECVLALKCLKNTFISYKTITLPYYHIPFALAKSVFETAGADKVKEQAIILQATILSSIKPDDPDQIPVWLERTKKFYQYLINCLEERLKQPEFVVDQIPYIYQAIAEIITSLSNCIFGDDLVALTRKQFQLVDTMQQNFEGLKTSVKQQAQDQYEDIISDDSDLQIDKLCSDSLEDALQRIPQVIQVLLKACIQPAAKLQIFSLCQSKIQVYLTKQLPLVHFALSLTVEIIKSFTYYEIQSQYPNFMNVLGQHIESPQPTLRNIVVYGFNLIFNKVPPTQLSAQYVAKILELLSKSFTSEFQNKPKDKDHLFYIKHCKDNVISALGSLLKYFGNAYPSILHQEIYKFWISHLPLEADKGQGDEQQEILIQFLNVNPARLINQTKDLLCVCEIFAKFVMKRREKEHKQIVEKTRRSLMMIKDWSLFKQSANYLWNSLKDSHKQTLTRLMTE